MIDNDTLSYLTDYERDLYKRGLYTDDIARKVADRHRKEREEAGYLTGPPTAEEELYAGQGLTTAGATGAAVKLRGKGIVSGLKSASLGQILEPPGLASFATDPGQSVANVLARQFIGDEMAAALQKQDEERLLRERGQEAPIQQRIEEARTRAGWLGQKAIELAPSATDVGVQVGAALVSRGRLTPALMAASGAARYGETYREGIEQGLSRQAADARAKAFGGIEGYLEKLTGGTVSTSAILNLFKGVPAEIGAEVATDLGQMGLDYATGNTEHLPKTWDEFQDRLGKTAEGALLLRGAVSPGVDVVGARQERGVAAEAARKLVDADALARKDASRISPTLAADPSFQEGVEADRAMQDDMFPDTLKDTEGKIPDMFSGELRLPEAKISEDADLERAKELAKTAPMRTLLEQRKRDAAKAPEPPAPKQLELPSEEFAYQPLFQPEQLAQPAKKVERTPVREAIAKATEKVATAKKTKEEAPKPVSLKDMTQTEVWSTGESVGAEKSKGLDYDALVKRLSRNDRATTAARHAIAGGNVKVVGDPRKLPVKNAPQGAKGMYDGKDVYIVSKNIDEKEIVPVMLHEVKHYYDQRGKSVGRGLRSILGDRNNEGLVTKIQDAAAKNDPIARQTVARFEAAEQVAGPQGRDEIVTYWLEETAKAREADKPLTAIARQIGSDLTTGVKLKYKELVGRDIDPSLKDLQYLAINLLPKKAAEGKAGTRLDMEVPEEERAAPKLSVIGRSAKMFNKYPNQYKGELDQLDRVEIDSSRSRLNEVGVERLRSGEKVSLGEAFSYDELYKNYPDMPKSLKVRVASKDEKAKAQYFPDEGVIEVAPRILDDPKQLRSSILHEVQHAIQHKEGFETGTSVKGTIKDPELKKKLDQLESEVDFTVSSLKRSGQFDTLVEASDYKYPANAEPSQVLQHILRRTAKGKSKKANEIVEKSLLLKKLRDKDQLAEKAYQDYLATYGEAEARVVQKRRDLTEGERDETTFDEEMERELRDVGAPEFLPSTTKLDAETAKFSVGPDVDVSYPKERGFGQPDTRKFITPSGKVISPDSAYSKAANAVSSAITSKTPDDIKRVNDLIQGEMSADLLEIMNKRNNVHNLVEASGPEALDALTKYAAIDNREARIAAYKKYQTEWPELFSAYNDMRKDIAVFSDAIASHLEGPRASELDKARATKIRQDLGNYITRSYTINAPRKVASAYVKTLRNTEQGRETIATARSFLAKHYVSFPKKWSERSREQLEMMYDFWGDAARRDVTDFSREELIEELEKVRDQATEEKISGVTDQLVDDLLAVGQRVKHISKAARLFRGGTLDLTIVSERQKVPQAIRDLWGETKDPVMSVFTTLVKQSEFLARIKEQQRLLDEYDGRYFFNNTTSGPKDAKLVKLDSDIYGPLRGKFTTQEIKDALDVQKVAVTSMHQWMENWAASKASKDFSRTVGDSVALALRGAAKVGGWTKWATVVAKPANWALNGLGSVMQLSMNGNFDLKTYGKGWDAAFHKAPQAYYKTKTDEDIKELVRGQLLDSVYAGEIQRAELDAIMERFYVKNPASRWHKAKSWVTDKYAAMDLYTKVANYYKEKQFVTDFYKALDKDISDTEIQRVAAERVQKTNFSYNRAWFPAKVLEQGGITNFMTYNTETFRTVLGNVSMAYADLKMASSLKESNPKAAAVARKRGLERVAGISIALGTASKMVSTIVGLASVLGLADEEDEKERQLKYLALPEYLKGSSPFLVQKSGTSREYLDEARLNPYGPLFETAKILANGAIEGDGSAPLEALKNLLILNKALDVPLQAGMEAATGGKVRARPPSLKGRQPGVYASGREIAQELGLSDLQYNTLVKGLEAVVPAVLTSVVPAALEIGGMEDDTGGELPDGTLKRLAEGFGFTTTKYVPEKDLAGKAFSLADESRKLRSDWNNYVESQKEIAPEEAKAKFSQMVARELVASKQARRAVQAAELAGVKPSEISEWLKTSQDKPTGLTNEQVASLANKRHKLATITEKQLNAKEKEELARVDKNLEKTKKIRKKYSTLRTELARFNRNYKPTEED